MYQVAPLPVQSECGMVGIISVTSVSKQSKAAGLFFKAYARHVGRRTQMDAQASLLRTEYSWANTGNGPAVSRESLALMLYCRESPRSGKKKSTL